MAKKIKVKAKKVIKERDFETALQYYNSGNLQQAEIICREILGCQQNHAEAWHMLGVISYQANKCDNAIQHISAAIRINPREYLKAKKG